MTPTLARVVDRVRQLADTLAELKVRVGRAVATEASRAVGETIRESWSPPPSARSRSRR